MKTIILLVIMLLVFGTAGYFGYNIYIKPKQEIAKEIKEEAENTAPTPTPVDPSLPIFQAAMELKIAGKLVEASQALSDFISTHAYSGKIYEAIDALGEVNTDILFSDVQSPRKTEYVVVSGDTLGRIAKRNDSTAEMIMRVNDMSGTMLQIGDRLMIPKYDFKLRIHVAAKVVDLYDGEQFFKRYTAEAGNASAPPAGSPIATTVREKIAWKDGKRVPFGSTEFTGSTRWIMLGNRSYTLYSDASATGDAQNPARGLQLSAEDIEELHTVLRNKAEVSIQ